MSAQLDLAALREQNVSRLARWHDPNSEPWTGADWSNAMCGESGEAANVVKKLRRHETRTSPQGDPPEAGLRDKLADEIADVVIYADLLAHFYGIETAVAVAAKFNRKSMEQGFPERLNITYPAALEPKP
jgi:NTP pyrophosphatase (non-canonical NTP hydrolase)